MNKAIKLLIIIVVVPFIAQAQSTKRQMAGLSIGPSFALSAFAKKDISDSTSGFAKTGISINFNYAYRVSHNFGLQVLVNYSGNGLNTSAYA
ncbi:MAG: hypothetical protein WC341_11325, partial [Bacteroidales bacterium]